MLASRELYHSLRQSQAAHAHLLKMLQRELGLPQPIEKQLEFEISNYQEVPRESYYQNLERCLNVFTKKVKHLKSQVQFFYGFKSTHGIDQNHMAFSTTNIFLPVNQLIYSS